MLRPWAGTPPPLPHWAGAMTNEPFSMARFLETPDPHFLPVTDVTVRWVTNPTLVARFPFALLNRQQLLTILDEPQAATVREEEPAEIEAAAELVNRRRWGAA